MIIYDMPPWMMTGFLFVFGAVFGSFLNVCVHRLPNHEGLWDSFKGLNHPPSRCPKCGARILTRDNLPVIGWLLLGGRCRACGTRISARYPTIEFLNGLLVVALYWLEVPVERFGGVAEATLTTPFGPTSAEFPLSDFWHVHARFAFHLLLCEVLLVASLIDFDLMVIPKVVTDPFIPVGIVGMGLGGMYLFPLHTHFPAYFVDADALTGLGDEAGLVPAWVRLYPHLHGLACGVAGALAGGLPILIVRWIGTAILRQEAMGAGDVYLMAMGGAFLGWQPVSVALVLSLFISLATIGVAAVVSRIVPRMNTVFPYGPFLSAGCVTVLFGWPWIWPRTGRLFSEMVRNWPFTAATAVALMVALASTLGLLQIIKRLLGISTVPVEAGDWTAADQNHYQSGERPDATVGQWDRPQWTGVHSSRGKHYERRWRGNA